MILMKSLMLFSRWLVPPQFLTNCSLCCLVFRELVWKEEKGGLWKKIFRKLHDGETLAYKLRNSRQLPYTR
jgi:hypothetical protein